MLLGLPERVVPVAWLCVGYPDERPRRPGLEAAGWARRQALDELVFAERWGERLRARPAPRDGRCSRSDAIRAPGWWRELASGVVPGAAAAAIGIRDASDELVKPVGSLGVLETTVERWAGLREEREQEELECPGVEAGRLELLDEVAVVRLRYISPPGVRKPTLRRRHDQQP